MGDQMIVGELDPTVVGYIIVGITLGVIALVWMFFCLLERPKLDEEESERELATKCALDRARRHWGRFPKLHSFVGKEAGCLISTDELVTQLLLINIFEPHRPARVISFSEILDVCYGEDAAVTVSGGAVMGALGGIGVVAANTAVKRSVSSRWLNIFVNSCSEPRVTLYMPSEQTAQQWYDLVRLGIARSLKQESA